VTKILEQHVHPKFPRLTIDRRSNSPFYQARAFIKGRLMQRSMRTRSIAEAMQLAAQWYLSAESADNATVKRVSAMPKGMTMGDLFIEFRKLAEPAKRRYFNMKWWPIEKFWKSILIADVRPKTFRAFYEWRRQPRTINGRSYGAVSNHSLYKDVCLIRQVLKYGMEEELLEALPFVPKVGKIAANPRPWLTPQEWKRLLRVSEKRIEDAASNPKLQRQRQDCHDFAVFMIGSMCRVGEVLSLRFDDCSPRERKNAPALLVCNVVGKTGGRTIIADETALEVYKQRLAAAGDAELVFTEHHREAFKELLKACGLYLDPKTGMNRNFKSLRATSISFAVIKPNANLLFIARNAGTSLGMIDAFYAKRLSAEMALASEEAS
jgi:integrase